MPYFVKYCLYFSFVNSLVFVSKLIYTSQFYVKISQVYVGLFSNIQNDKPDIGQMFAELNVT